jgi:hypothetical protein
MINRDLEQLADPFKGKAVRLVELIAREGIPFRVFETRRSFTRSQELFMQGRTYVQGVVKVTGPIVTNARPGSSPHNWGLAVDCVLVTDPQHAWWAGEALPKGPWGHRTCRPHRARVAALRTLCEGLRFNLGRRLERVQGLSAC